MARYRMEDGCVLDTANATAEWEEDTYFDGHNRIGVATGSQWNHETLYRSRKGRYLHRAHRPVAGQRELCRVDRQARGRSVAAGQ